MNKIIKQQLESRITELEDYADCDYYEYELDEETLVHINCNLFNGVVGHDICPRHDLLVGEEEVESSLKDVNNFFDFVLSVIELTQL